MSGLLAVLVQTSGATSFLEHGKEATALGSPARAGAPGLLWQMQSSPVRP